MIYNAQQKVLLLMLENWELGIDTGAWRSNLGQRRARLQKNGLGKGGDVAYFKASTIGALTRKGFIEAEPNDYVSLNPTKYHLTKKGRIMAEKLKGEEK